MQDFTIGGAWTLGFRFFGGRWLAHGAILVLIGLLLPIGVEYAVLGSPAESAGPGFGPNPMGPGLFDRPDLLLVMMAGFLLQSGSYFACWRLGFDGGGSVPDAILFGLPAGLVAAVTIAPAFVVASYIWRPFLAPETIFLAILLFLLPIILVSATFFVSATAFFAALMILLLVFAMVYGAAMGQMGFAATMVGGSGIVTVLLLVLSGLSFWIAARMSCVGPLMADRKSLNLFAAVGESWRITLDEQWAITRYLALVGGAVALLVIGGSLAIGASMTAMLPGEGDPGATTLAQIGGLLLGIPFAFLAVALPAGIYRQLTGEETPAEIFE